MTRWRAAAWAALFLALGPARPAVAFDIVDAILADLRQQGYVDTQVSRTLLGRTRIVTHNRAFDREIIVNPGTGEILRDYWQPLADGAAASGTSEPEPLDASGPDDNQSGKGKSGSSGSGSSGSGSSPGGSGSGGSSGGSGGGSGGSGSGGSGHGGSGGSGGGSGGGGSDDG